MKHIVFVDDEPNLLQGLKRTLRSMRHEWHMEFATCGQAALNILAKDSFDVIVTDMRMPDMDGVQLLNEVKKRYPHVVRFILSGQTDKETFLSSSSVMHQFIAKPCDTKFLKSTIERICKLQNILQNDSIKKMVMEIETLPSISGLYADIMEELQSPDFSMERVGKIISTDADMTAKIMKLANSAYYGIHSRVSNPMEATVVLGLNTIKALALFHCLFSCFKTVSLKGFCPDAFWDHSMTTGAFSKLISQVENVSPEIADDALVAGMLHDIGKLVLATHLPDGYKKVISLTHKKKLTEEEAEREIFGDTHAEVGAYLIGLWGIYNPIIEAIAYHHSPGKCQANQFTLVTATYVANILGNELFYCTTDLTKKVDIDYLERLNLTDRLSLWQKACT